MNTTIAYDIQFSDINEARARVAVEGLVGGCARCSHTWTIDGVVNARAVIDADDVGALVAELEADDRISGYARSRIARP